MNFCPDHKLDKFELYKDLQLFIRKLILRKLYQKQDAKTTFTPKENRALDQLVALLEESDTSDLIDQIDLPRILQQIDDSDVYPHPGASKLKKKSDLCPPPSTCPNASIFLKLVNNDLDKLRIKQQEPSNLNPKELEALHSLKANDTITIKPSDKGGNV